MSSRLFLDDERVPADVTWITLHEGPFDIVRTQSEFQAYVTTHGVPSVISFDNDLGEGQGEGIDCAKWLVEQVLDGAAVVPADFAFTVHSKNPVGAVRIQGLLSNFLEHLRMTPERA